MQLNQEHRFITLTNKCRLSCRLASLGNQTIQIRLMFMIILASQIVTSPSTILQASQNSKIYNSTLISLSTLAWSVDDFSPWLPFSHESINITSTRQKCHLILLAYITRIMYFPFAAFTIHSLILQFTTSPETFPFAWYFFTWHQLTLHFGLQ